MKTLLITQARLGSNRLPKKVLLKIGNESMLSLHLKRIKKAELIDEILVATTHEDGVEEIISICNQLNIKYYQGNTYDVLDRFYRASKDNSPEWVVRVTSDCPLIDPILIDKVIRTALDTNSDYCSNILTEDFPDGQDVEVFKFSVLETAWKNAKLNSEREHVTPYIKKNSDFNSKKMFTAIDVKCHSDFNLVRMTVDEFVDLETIRLMVKELGTSCGWEDYKDYLINNNLSLKNKFLKRNQGYLKSLKSDK